jgi:hypothetical protein
VNSCIRAYSGHYHLILRADDVWLAILTRLSLYINANAETLRNVFVSHEGKKEGFVNMGAGRHACDWARIANVFTFKIEDHVKDARL